MFCTVLWIRGTCTTPCDGSGAQKRLECSALCSGSGVHVPHHAMDQGHRRGLNVLHCALDQGYMYHTMRWIRGTEEA